MADQALVELLKKSVQEWNELRAVNPGKVDLSRADLRWVNLRHANLSEANLNNASLCRAHLGQANLTRADLRGANCSMAYLNRVDFKGANLQGANLIGAELFRADFSQAVLLKADFRGANLVETVFRNTDFSELNLAMATIRANSFADVDFSEVKGLKEITHSGPSYISIDTIYRSKGKIPFAFLRGAGVPENFIEYMHSLVGSAFEFYSCFISYSTKDQEFAERLHADLQNNGVRCWFAPHDAKAGLKLHEQIDQAIRLHEKLLLILSSDSIASNWVKIEIKKAAKRQMKEKRDILFPVSLIPFNTLRDWECWDGDLAKDLAAEIREYLIPDFCQWEDHKTYKKAFNKLLKDLQSGKTKA